MSNFYKTKQQASYTVEAAFVIPIVFFVIFFFLSYTFYCYDRSKLQAEIDDIIRKASSYMAYEVDLYTDEIVSYKLAEKNLLFVLFGDRSAKEKNLRDYIKDRLESMYYITSVDSVAVSTTVATVRISGVAHMRIPIMSIFNKGNDYTFDVEFSHEESIFPREEKVRIMTAAMELGTKIKGVDSVLKRVREFIDCIH